MTSPSLEPAATRPSAVGHSCWANFILTILDTGEGEIRGKDIGEEEKVAMKGIE